MNRTFAARNSSTQQTSPHVVTDVLRSPGAPLDQRDRAFFGSRFGHDFSSVRVHTDAKASDSTRAVGALAYTVGPHIAWRSGTYSPSTPQGMSLMAHELAHVVQQSTGRAELGLYRQKDHTSDDDQRKRMLQAIREGFAHPGSAEGNFPSKDNFKASFLSMPLPPERAPFDFSLHETENRFGAKGGFDPSGKTWSLEVSANKLGKDEVLKDTEVSAKVSREKRLPDIVPEELNQIDRLVEVGANVPLSPLILRIRKLLQQIDARMK